mgnify:CR=1 FL=1
MFQFCLPNFQKNVIMSLISCHKVGVVHLKLGYCVGLSQLDRIGMHRSVGLGSFHNVKPGVSRLRLYYDISIRVGHPS